MMMVNLIQKNGRQWIDRDGRQWIYHVGIVLKIIIVRFCLQLVLPLLKKSALLSQSRHGGHYIPAAVMEWADCFYRNSDR